MNPCRALVRHSNEVVQPEFGGLEDSKQGTDIQLDEIGADV
jgi:hypothetical protein